MAPPAARSTQDRPTRKIGEDRTLLALPAQQGGSAARAQSMVEKQAFFAGDAVVHRPVDGWTVVFAAFFDAGLRFPCDVLLPKVLQLFQVELPQLSPSVLVRIAIFD